MTCFVGDNGSGKSTLIEAIAEACALPIWGGSRNETANRHGPDQRAALGTALRLAFSRRPCDGYFFRAELQSNFASLLDERRDDPDFEGDPCRSQPVRDRDALANPAHVPGCGDHQLRRDAAPVRASRGDGGSWTILSGTGVSC